ncbi:O-antigen ligase [Microbacterium phyllosphaerae]|uniref:O-antigen ligase n=1 Tax=Microbacterium phyllosphaerae TaxID=124798 RepID=A0ABS4WS25_9MICO|nr:O-antigen ligase family protein [Microbacterium phyllosphaerae]MBP2378294.1 O-antigen ligase [Microbacterium phyllosphaerae]
MAHYTKHPVAAPPTAPERESTGHLLLRGYIILVLFATFAHSAVYNLLGEIGAAITLVAFLLSTLAIGIPMIARKRPNAFAWRRLPWAATGYTVLALISIAWSQWPGATIVTWVLLATVTVNALFIVHVLTWHEIVRALASAFKWILGLSLAMELWVALVVQTPILPNFFVRPEGEANAHWYWVRGNLLDGGRIQGIVGNSNLLAIICLFAIITFGVLFAARVRWRTTLALWTLLAAYFLLRAGSATAYACAAAAAVVLVVALLMRRAKTPGGRTRLYVVFIGGAVVVSALVWLLREPLFALLGRSADLTGRSDKIWDKVLERASQHPIFGNGFSSPWVPFDPAFDGWITDHGITVFHAHNMWLDVLLQLGVVGVIIMALAYLSLLWRSWFFAIDRPRWDLKADRSYSAITLLPSLFTIVLLVQGLTESTPIMLWGWMLLVLLSFKIKAVPLVGIGERERVIERGERARRVP